MKRKTLVILWLCAILFPLNWLRQESSFVRRHFDALFRLEIMHILMHLLLFGGLVLLIVKTFQLPLNRKSALLLILLILSTGLLQELLQLLVKQRDFGWSEVFDLGVDLAGGVLGWLILLIYSKINKVAKGME